MEINVIRIVVELSCFGLFIGIVAWAYSPRRRSALERAARSVLED